MNSTIKKCLILLLSFVMAFSSTPSYTFASIVGKSAKSQAKAAAQDESVLEEVATPFLLSAPASGWKSLDWLKGYYTSKNLDTDDWTTKPIVVPNDKALIMLSHVNPAEYYDKNIVINPSGGDPTFHIESDTTVSYSDESFSFYGLCGDENWPYQGTLSVADMTIMTDVPLFLCLSDQAKMTGTLKFTHRYHTTRPLLAEMVVHQEGVTSASLWPMEVYTETVGQSTGSDSNPIEPEYHVGGLVGTIGESAKIELSFANYSGKDGTAALSFTANEAGGVFAGNMAESSELSVSYQEVSPSPVIGNVTGFSTRAGVSQPITGPGAEANVGALVGSMAESSNLVLKDTLSFQGSVTAAKGNAGGLVGNMAEESTIELPDSLTVQHDVSVTDGNAGGLVGYMDGGAIKPAEGKTVTVKNNTIKGSGHAGGLFGYYATKKAITYDDSYKVSGVTLSGGKSAGGLFGVLRNVKTDAMTEGIRIEITKPVVSSKYSGGNGAYGGLIGCYKADDRSAILSIHDATVPSTINGNSSAYGGVIGRVANKIDSDATGYSYITMEDITLNETNNSGANIYGGVIGEVEKGHLINLGNVKVTTSNSINGNLGGGVIGKMQEASVLRLHGTTDLSAIQSMNESASSGQMVGSRERALIYAVGSGSDAETTGDYWRFLRMTQRKRVSDVGSYGEVLRLEGSKLKEKKLAVDEAASGNFEDDEIIRFSPSLHQVVLYQANPTEIATTRDFAALSIYIQQEGKAEAGGCFSFAGNSASLSVNSSSVSGNITITADINMSGTGIMGLMRSNDSSRYYTGTFKGGNHTLTLTAGELYGIAGSEDLSGVSVTDYETAAKAHETTYVGCGEIYNQSYLGLFSKLQDATIQNLKVDGYLHFDAGSNIYAGVIAGEVNGTVKVINVDVDSDVVYGGESWSSDIYASGYFGTVNGKSDVTFEDCDWSGSLKNYKSAGSSDWGTLNGGFIAYVNRNQYNNSSDQVKVSIKNCTAKDCTIEDTFAVKNARNGVLLGEAINLNAGYGYNQFTVEGLSLENVTISSCATEQSSGLLAYGMNFTDFDVTGLSIKDCSLTCADKKAIFGGLATKATGYWKIHTSAGYPYGIKYSGNNSFSGKSAQTTGSTGSTSGLLVACGQDNDKKQAIYLEVGEDAYVIDTDSVRLDLTGTYFDEFVGNTINFSQDGVNGIVSIATTGGKGLDQTAAYVNRTSSSWQNDATRYYYNLDKIRYEDGTQTVRDLSQGVDCGKDLLCWSVADYAASNIDPYFNSGSGLGKNIQGTIDLTGLSFYPLETKNYLNFNADTTITFGYEAIQNKNTESIHLDDSLRQHYMMQYGLYRDIVVNNQALTVEVKDLTLQGTVGYDSTYCGVLICGTVTGTYDSNNSTIYDTTLKLSDVTLDGIRLTGFTNSAGYAPLLIRSIGEYTNLTIDGLQTTEKYSNASHDQTPEVATSLIGTVGSDTAKVVNLTFADLALDGRSLPGAYENTYGTCNSIFTKAILLHSFQYISGSGQYNFASTEKPRITYGQEISNSEGGTVSGRNNDLQFNYYNGGNVLNPWSANNNPDSMPERFASGFLPYVYWGEEKDAAGNQVSTSHELDINLKVDFFENGCGTYSDPYIVEDGMQLERLAAYINDGTKLNGMKVQVDADQLKNQTGTLVTAADEHNHVMYSVEGGEWKPVDASTEIPDNLEDKIRSYLRNAYYMITEDITLGSSGSYYGIGNATVADTVEQGKTFSGVIVGKKQENGEYPVITMKAPKKAGTVFAGLVSCANGCVVKDLVLDYTKTQIEISGSTSAYTNSLGNVSLFGGVIGRVLGGDNIIDNVEVRYIDNSVKVTESTTDNNYAYLAAVGGYVGMVGWDYRGGGGVIFRNIPEHTHTDSEEDSYLSVVSFPTKTSPNPRYTYTEYNDGNNYYYANPYVGRVTDAYVCYEKTSTDSNVLAALNNTDKNYQIPTLSAGDKLSVGQWYSSVSDQIEVTVGSPQQLWVLSAIVNSGATAMNCDTSDNLNVNNNIKMYYGGGFSNQNGWAYNYGKVRYGTYENIGQPRDTIPEEENWWSGKEFKSAEKVSYLVKEYTTTPGTDPRDIYHTFSASHLTENKARVGITMSANCKMTSYGNGFRGIGGSYNRYGKSEADYRRVVLQAFSAGNYTITLGMSDHEYFEEANDGSSDNTLRCLSSALFPVIRLLAETGDTGLQADTPRIYENAVISGSVTKDFYRLSNNTDVSVPTGSEQIFTGGLVGSVRDTNTSWPYPASYVRVSNVLLKDLTIKGGYDSGGIFAYMYKSASRNIQFLSCDLQNLTIEGTVCCGGYIGAYNKGTNNNVIAVNTDFYGTTTASAIVRDSTFSCALKKQDSCEGVVLGYSDGKTYVANMSIVSSSFGTNGDGSSSTFIGGIVGIQSGGILNASNVVVSGCAFAVKGTIGALGGLIGKIITNSSALCNINDCCIVGEKDHSVSLKNASNIGGLIGQVGQNNSGNITIKIESCRVGGETDNMVTLDNASNIGGLIGYANPLGGDTTISGSAVNRVTMENSTDIGGIVGKISTSQPVMIRDCQIQHVTGVTSSGNLGGACGNISAGSPLFTGLEIDGITLLGEKAVGGIIGRSSAQNVGVSNSTVKNSKIATVTEDQYYRPNSGSVGVLLGAGSGALKGYNILSRDNLCGYQLKEGQPDNYNSSVDNYKKLVISDSITQRTVDTTVSLDQARALSAATIGLKDVGPYSYANQAVKQEAGNESINYTDMRVFIPYADLEKTGVADASSDAPYRFTAGNIGCWVGYIESNIDALQLVGISKKGDYLPNADVGYCQSTGGTFIYGDYQDSVSTKADAAGDEVSPYITTNPVSDVLKDLYTTADGSTKLSLTGDATVFADNKQKIAMAQQILADYKTGAADQWNKIYGSVDGTVYEAFDVGGKYKDKLTDYQTAEAYEASKAGCDTFPILVIDTLEANEITEIINDYVSVVTNSKQTRESHSYSNVEITTFRWDTDHFTCYDSNNEKITPSLKWVAGDYNQVRAVTGKYDNSRSQFTLVDVQFSSPVTDDSSIYHIYVPVLVKKILPFKMYIAATNGTDYALESYDDLSSTVIASHGESVTMRLTYQYLRTKEEWENSVNGGENYLWKFDKAISLGGANTSSLPAGTWLALVDVNDGGKMYDFTVEDANSLPKNVLTFSDAFPSWYEKEASYFCERLPLEATEDAESGEMVVTEHPEQATVFVQGTYYRPYNNETDADVPRYHIKCTADNQTEGDFNGYVEVTESYFLTICTPQNAKKMIYAHANYVSIKGGMPSQKLYAGAQRGTENILVIGNFFAQNTMNVTTYSNTNDKLTDLMPSVNGEMEVQINFNGDTPEEKAENKTLFNQNSSAVAALWQQFSMQMKEYDAGENSQLFTIPLGTMIRIDRFEISYTDLNDEERTVTLSTEDYAKTYSVSEESRAGFDPLNVLSYLKAGKQGVKVKMYFEVTFSEDGLERLPKRVNDQGTEGVAIKGLSKISYQKSGLANAAAKDGEGANHYWSAKDVSASLEYEADEYDWGLADGYHSQLGINALEDTAGSMISNGFYDMSSLEDVSAANGIHYTLQLLRKESDNTYVVVDMRDYLSNVSIQGQAKEADVADLSTDIRPAYGNLVYNERSKCAELYLDWDGSAHTDDRIWNVPVTFDITTGWDGDDTRYYSNYKVILSVEIGTFNESRTTMAALQDSRAEDYIIYTNAKIYTGIVP